MDTLCALRMAVVQIANNAMDRLKSTFHSSPPVGEEMKPMMVKIDVAIAAYQMNRRLGDQSEAKTTRMYGTPPATPRASSESIRKITTERIAHIAIDAPSDNSVGRFFFIFA